MLRSIPRKLLVAGLVLIVLGLAYFVLTQNERVNSGQATAPAPSPSASSEPTAEQQPVSTTPSSSDASTSETPRQKVDTAPLNELDASLNDNVDDEVDDSL